MFDLLGDLYMMPIAGRGGAPATRITSGPAFDMQPRFSPDGKRIAYTSDRDGLFNIWVMDADGKNAPPCRARRRLVREQPDLGARRRLHLRAPPLRRNAIARRRRDVDVPRSGADGVQVTEKVGFQKDAGEPALSPDGKYPLLQQGRHAEPDLRIRQEPARRHLRDHPARAGDRA